MIDLAMYKMGMEMLAKADGIAEKSRLRKGAHEEIMWIPGR